MPHIGHRAAQMAQLCRLIIAEIDKCTAALRKAHIVGGYDDERTPLRLLYEKRFNEGAVVLIERGRWLVGKNDSGLAIYRSRNGNSTLFASAEYSRLVVGALR